MSRFARIKSEDERLDALGDPAGFGDFDENDPASVGRFMKKMGREFGDDLGDDFEDAMEESMSESESGEHAEGLAESSAGPESGAGDDL
jgi:hypothetical protein